MNITVQGDRSFCVTVTIWFYNVRKKWVVFPTADDNVKVKELTDGVTASVVFTVVGRQPHELEKIMLEYDGHTVTLVPGPDKFANLSPIVLYKGGRDYWSNQLHQKALEAHG